MYLHEKIFCSNWNQWHLTNGYSTSICDGAKNGKHLQTNIPAKIKLNICFIKSTSTSTKLDLGTHKESVLLQQFKWFDIHKRNLLFRKISFPWTLGDSLCVYDEKNLCYKYKFS